MDKYLETEEEIEEENYDIACEIYEAENMLRRMERDVRELWDNVIVPYKSDICRSQILDKLDEYDYVKFYDFMITKNRAYRKAKRLLDFLNEL